MTNIINEIIVLYEDYHVAQIDKAYVQMLIGDWDSYNDTVSNILDRENDNILALKMMTFYIIAREGNIDRGCEYLDNLYDTMEK